MGAGFRKFQKKFRPLSTEELVELFKEDERFYFTGSRAFKEKDRWGSYDFSGVDDWDFSVENSAETEEYLEKLGFAPQEDSDEYEVFDDTFVCLYRHPDHNIDVVVREYFEDFKFVWDHVSLDFYYNYLWKSAPHRSQDEEAVREHKKFIGLWLEEQLNVVRYLRAQASAVRATLSPLSELAFSADQWDGLI